MNRRSRATVPDYAENESAAEEGYLLDRIAAGDRQALRLLYGRYSPVLFALALRLLRDRQSAEEALQDTFLKVWRHAGAFDGTKSRPFTWTHTILRRTCIDFIRRRGTSPSAASLDAEPGALRHLAAADDVRTASDRAETAGRVRSVLAEAPPEQRRALELALFSGLTQTEIAGCLQQPVGTVKSWIRRGLIDLRHQLSDHTDDT